MRASVTFRTPVRTFPHETEGFLPLDGPRA